MSNIYNNMSKESSRNNLSSFNTLERELSIRDNHPSIERFREMSIQSNFLDYNSDPKLDSKPATSPLVRMQPTVSPSNNSSKQTLSRPMSSVPQTRELSRLSETSVKLIPSKQQNRNEKLKYVSTDNNNFRDFYSFGNKLGQNYNTNQESELLFGDSARRKNPARMQPESLNKNMRNGNTSMKNSSGNGNTNNKFITNLVNTEDKLKINQNMLQSSIVGYEKSMSSSTEMSNTAAKIPKASEEYWDNTKRRNLDTSIYTNNPMKIQGRGFGNVNEYDLFLNGVGTSTRQENPDIKPQNVDNDRLYLTNQNYHYDKFHVTENLPCGADTRYLNKNML